MNPDGTGGRDGQLEHATVVEIDGSGVIIRGPSGSGKTSLAIELMQRCRANGIASALVADDYALLSADPVSGRLRADVPERIAGLIELRGCGVVAVAPDRFKPTTQVALAVLLTDRAGAERVADPDRTVRLAGVAVPELALLSNSPVSAAHAALGWLDLAGRII